MSPNPSPAPSPAPAPAKVSKPSLKTILTDAEMVLAGLATAGEAVLTTLPSGPAHTAIAIALPVIVTLVAAVRKLGG